MAKLKVSLNIGLSNADQQDIIDVDNEELDECNTEEEREELLQGYWQDWANNYIDGYFDLVD